MAKPLITCLPFRAGILLLITYTLFSCSSAVYPSSYRISLPPESFSGNQFMRTKILGSIAIGGGKVDGLPIVEMSDLAWDETSETLYAISDDGYLYTIKLTISDSILKSATITHATHLKGADRKPLRGADNDPEGLDIRHVKNGRQQQTELLISFENNSRIARYNTQGEYLGNTLLPKKLQQRSRYRHTNKALESVVIHPRHGILTAAEHPIKGHSSKVQSIYSQHGREWHFPRHSASQSAITALEVLDNGDVLVLERAYSGLFRPLVISLRQVQLKRCNRKGHCPVKDIAVFSSAQGWNMDNFEGLTRLPNNRYLMASDDNKNPLQQTLMVMFEVTP